MIANTRRVRGRDFVGKLLIVDKNTVVSPPLCLIETRFQRDDLLLILSINTPNDDWYYAKLLSSNNEVIILKINLHQTNNQSQRLPMYLELVK